MSEQPALKDDAVASFIVTIRDHVKAERERDVARAERDKALAEVERGKRHCDEAVKTWRDLYREAIGIPPSEHQARRMEEMAAKSERVAAERDEALRLHVEDHARIDVLLAERDRARGVAVKLEQEADRLGWRLLLNAIYPENQPPVEGAPRWDEDAIVLRFGWLADRCGRCGEELKAETVAAERERDEAQATLARVRALADKCDRVGLRAVTVTALRAALEGP